MTGGRHQPILLEQVANLRWCPAKVSGELDFLVSGGFDLGESAGNVVLHQIPDSVKLQSDFVQLAAGGDCRAGEAGIQAGKAESGNAESREK